jgi:hypothetical protein
VMGVALSAPLPAGTRVEITFDDAEHATVRALSAGA